MSVALQGERFGDDARNTSWTNMINVGDELYGMKRTYDKLNECVHGQVRERIIIIIIITTIIIVVVVFENTIVIEPFGDKTRARSR